jgi:hypothetical protein
VGITEYEQREALDSVLAYQHDAVDRVNYSHFEVRDSAAVVCAQLGEFAEST